MKVSMLGGAPDMMMGKPAQMSGPAGLFAALLTDKMAENVSASMNAEKSDTALEENVADLAGQLLSLLDGLMGDKVNAKDQEMLTDLQENDSFFKDADLEAVKEELQTLIDALGNSWNEDAVEHFGLLLERLDEGLTAGTADLQVGVLGEQLAKTLESLKSQGLYQENSRQSQILQSLLDKLRGDKGEGKHPVGRQIRTDMLSLLSMAEDLVDEAAMKDFSKNFQKLLSSLQTGKANSEGQKPMDQGALPLAQSEAGKPALTVGMSAVSESLLGNGKEHTANQPQSFPLQTENLSGKAMSETQAREIMRQLSNALHKSNFTAGLHAKSLTIRLYPEHLGTLRIELMQQEGVMMARILTSSHLSKGALDSQLHQLRQAFIQQNIQVDKIDISYSQEMETYQEQEREQKEEQQEADKANKVRKEKTSDEEIFNEFLNDLLFEGEA